jgi:spore coat polysaccharide biosynthesis protein SpsF
MRIGVLIDARMTGPPLPLKVLTDLAGRPMLCRVVERARAATTVDEVAVVTTRAPVDDPIAHFCDEFGVLFFRGDAADELRRFARAAATLQLDVIGRIAANGPLLAPTVIDEVVRSRASSGAHYAGNTLVRSYPRGFDVEVVTRTALDRAAAEAQEPGDRSSPTAYIVAHPDRFRLHAVRYPQDLSSLRWCVEGPSDLAFIREVYLRCGEVPEDMESLREVLAGADANAPVGVSLGVESGTDAAGAWWLERDIA